MPPDPLVGRHAYLCATCYYHPATTIFPPQLKILQLPPSSPPSQLKILPLPPSSPPLPPPPPPNSKSSRYHPLSLQLKIIPLPPSSPQLKIIPLPPSSPPTQNHPATTLFPPQLKILYEILLIFQSFLEGERWPGLID